MLLNYCRDISSFKSGLENFDSENTNPYALAQSSWEYFSRQNDKYFILSVNVQE